MSDPQIVVRFESLIQPYTNDRVQLPFYSLTVEAVDGLQDVYLVDFQLSGETAISFHFDLAQSGFRVLNVGPKEVNDFDALTQVFDHAKAFVAAARSEGFQEGDVRR